MTVQKEASQLWWFDSHNNSQRSRWLQSTLSELEEKTKGMLKLIEGDADTFAQRAEMYYKKRPELVSMIEDFYRAYRSLAERYDKLKLESGTSFSNRGWFHKEWSSIEKSSESSSVMFDSEVSEVYDPESEEEQVESKLREVPKKKSGSYLANQANKEVERLEERFKEDISDLFTDFVDSGLSEVSYPESEEAQVESKWREFPEKKSDGGVVNLMTEEVKGIEGKVRDTTNKSCEHSEVVYGEPEEAQDESNLRKFPDKERESDLYSVDSGLSEVSCPESEEAQVESKLREFPEKKTDGGVVNLITEEVKGIEGKVRDTTNKSCEHSEVVYGEPEEAPDESNLRKFPDKERESDLYSVDSGLSEVSCPESEEAQVESKLREFPEKKSDGGVVNLMTEEVKGIEGKVRDTTNKSCEHSETVYGEPDEAQDASNLRKFPDKLRDSDLLNLFAERIKSKVKKAAEKSSESSFDCFKESEVDGPKIGGAQVKCKLREGPENKSDSDVVKLMSEVQRLKEENVAFKAELERKDEEKREVIRQLSLSVDILNEENHSLRKFIKDTKKMGSAFEFKKLKGDFSGKLF